MKATDIKSYQVLDSRGRPTVACTLIMEDGSRHTAKVPSGASTGRHEAKELRDIGTIYEEEFFKGKSVHLAVENINSIVAPLLVGAEINLETVDALLVSLDESPDHSTLGANATLAVSISACKADAHSRGQSLARYFNPNESLALPMPMVNILSGGAHANKALDIQDVLIVPHGATNFSEALSWVVAIRELAAAVGRESGLLTHLVADEGGLGLPFPSINAACDFVVKVIRSVGLVPGHDVSLALDIASTEFYESGNYHLATENRSFTSPQFVELMHGLVSQQPIVSIEDPFAEDDWGSWAEFTSKVSPDLQVLGDDLFTTNPTRLQTGISQASANSILIKPNQNGLVSKTYEVLKSAQAAGFRTVVSARSGETEDSWLSDFATGWSAGQIKVGSTHGSERNAKWNRLIELELTEDTFFSNPFRKGK